MIIIFFNGHMTNFPKLFVKVIVKVLWAFRRAISTRKTLEFYTPLLRYSLPLTPVTSTHLNPVKCTEARAILHTRKEVEGCHENVF